MGLRETLEAARSPAITESRGLLSEDHSEIETVPDESREVWTRQPTSGYTVEQYECDRAARKKVRQRLAEQDAELERLREERDGLRWQLDDLRRQAMEMKEQGIWPVSKVVERAEAAEAEVRQLREERDEAQGLLARILDYGAAGYAEHQARRSAWASRDASPSGGDGAK